MEVNFGPKWLFAADRGTTLIAIPINGLLGGNPETHADVKQSITLFRNQDSAGQIDPYP